MSGAGVQPDVLEVPTDMPGCMQTPEMSPGCCMSGEVRCFQMWVQGPLGSVRIKMLPGRPMSRVIGGRGCCFYVQDVNWVSMS